MRHMALQARTTLATRVGGFEIFVAPENGRGKILLPNSKTPRNLTTNEVEMVRAAILSPVELKKLVSSLAIKVDPASASKHTFDA